MNCQIRINKLNRFFNDVVQIWSVLIINKLDLISGKILREYIKRIKMVLSFKLVHYMSSKLCPVFEIYKLTIILPIDFFEYI